MGLFSKKTAAPKTLPPEPPPTISDSDLADAERIMDRWDASMGNSNAMWDCLEAIGRRGGFRGAEANLMEVMDGRDSTWVVNRPWRWWNQAAHVASTRGMDTLVGRIFLFTHFYLTELAPKMNYANEMDTGLVRPAEGIYKDIAGLAVYSLARLDPYYLIHDTATGKVDVFNAIKMAEQVSGVTAPRPAASPTQPMTDDGSQWNTL